MKLATTTEDFAPYFGADYLECLRQVVKAGFHAIDLSQYIVHENDALLIRDDWQNTVEEIRACAEELGVEFVQSHSPGGRMFLNRETRNEVLYQQAVRSIQVCGALKIPNLVVHSGFWEGISKAEYFEVNRKFYRELLSVAEENGVNILAENSPLDNLEIGYFLTTGAEMREFVKYVDHPLMHACWDTGHANTLGAQYHHLVELGDELYGVHINDNRGKDDEHTMPFLGTMSLDDVMHGLLDSGYKGAFTFEACRLLRPAEVWFGKRRAFPSDTRLREPTFEMHFAMEKLLYEIGVYALKTYGCWEE